MQHNNKELTCSPSKGCFKLPESEASSTRMGKIPESKVKKNI